MKVSEKLSVICISMLLAGGLGACDQKPGPGETAGKKLDQTVDAAGRKIDETGQKISDANDALAEKLSKQSARTGVAIDDTEITAKVKATIFAEPGLRSLQISVDTVKGVVTLTGSADSKASSDRIEALAAAVAGVNDVENKLQVKAY